MFQQDQALVADYVQSRGPAGFEHVALFVLLTIRQPLHRVAHDLRTVGAGDDSPLWGSKGPGARYVAEHATELYWAAREHVEAGNIDAALEHVARIPGLGLVKAGFVLQLCWGVSGCLDTHNLVRFSISAKQFELTGLKHATRLQKASKYNALVAELGGTEALWDGWCEWAFERGRGNKAHFTDAQDVSREHCRALGLGE
ncbi:MAG: hypothetical protein V3S01_06785 [Dehalococcoidia bacterium]